MGKKNKADDDETYEVWMLRTDGEWYQVARGGNAIHKSRNTAMLLAEKQSHEKDVVETMVISRRPITTFNGEAIGLKHKIRPVEKKEKVDVQPEVHSDREKEGVVLQQGPEHVGEAAPDRS